MLISEFALTRSFYVGGIEVIPPLKLIVEQTVKKLNEKSTSTKLKLTPSVIFACIDFMLTGLSQ